MILNSVIKMTVTDFQKNNFTVLAVVGVFQYSTLVLSVCSESFAIFVSLIYSRFIAKEEIYVRQLHPYYGWWISPSNQPVWRH